MIADLRSVVVAAAVLGFVGSPLASQDRGSIRGVITNIRAKRPIEGARISLAGTPYVVTTDHTGGFSFTQETTKAQIGPIQLNVKEKKEVGIPEWLSIGAVVIGGVLLVMGFRKA